METNSWRPTQGEPASMPDGRSDDWKIHLQPEARQRIVNKIMDTLKRHLPISEPEGLNELQKLAIRFEEKIYTAAVDQSDYLRKISQKMLSVDKKPQHSGGSGQINPSIKQNPVDLAQINNQGQPVTTMNPPSRQQLLPQNMQNNSSIASQSTSTLSSALPSIIGPSQSTISSVSQSSSLQNMTGILQNSVTNSLGQASAMDIYSTAQRQMQGRQQQQQMISQQQHQSQNQLLYQQQQFQAQLLKQKLQQSTLSQSHVQQQSLLQQTTQLQSSQQPLIPVTSNLQSGQSSIQQTQPGAIQSIMQSGLSQNSLSSVQHSGTSLLQQQSQSLSRQQQQPQSNMLQQTPLQQHQTSAPQHSNLPMQQHQQFMCQQSNINVQQSQLVGQQTSGTEMQQQQQRLPTQQNNLLSMQQSKHLLNQQSMPLHQQQMLGSQTNISGLSQQQQQQQQQQMLESLSNVSNVQQHQRPMHVLPQAKTVVQQPQNQQAPLAMLQAQGQLQNQSLQKQHVSHIQLQTAPLQQQLVQQHIGSLQRDMQQRVPASGSLLPQDAIEHQKQFVQSQMGLQEVSSSSTLDSISPTGIVAVDLQEEIYQKVKSMKDLYFADLNDFYQWVSLKLQQNDALPSAKAAEQFQKMKGFKKMLECILQVLQSPKANIHPSLKDKIPMYEKQILNILASNKRKAIPSQPPGQQQFQHPSSSHSQFVQQQQQTQISQLQQHDNYTNQQNNIQGSSNSMQAPAVQGMQHVSVPLSAQFGVTSQQNISNALQTGSTVDTVQGNSFSSLQTGAIAPMQQGGLVSARSSIAQQSNANVMPNASMNSLQNNAIAKKPSPNVMQQQHFKQEQQHLMSNPQLKQQLQQRHMQQHLSQQQQKQQLLLAQQPLQQQLQQQQQKQQLLQAQQPLQQQQTSQMPLHQIQQLHQSNEVNDLRLRQTPGIKPGLCQQHYSTGQRHSYYQVKPGVAFPISSPQNFQASSPQASHNSSPQIDQRCQLSSQIKSGTPLQSANSPFVLSPSTPTDPSPIPGESEKQFASFTSLPNVGHVGHQQTEIAPQSQSLAVATPGISASPLLAEYSCPDGNQTSVLNLVPGKASTTERPLERLIEVIQSSTPEARSSAVSDIQSVVSMIDRIASSAPGNGSRAAVGEDLIAMTKCRLQARSFMSQDGSGPTKRIKRDISSMPLNDISSAGSINDSLKQSYGLDTSELESTATSLAKQQKFEVNHALIEEIRELNQWLIVTVVNISEEGIDSISAASEGKGTIVKCFFNAVALCPGLKSQFASEDMGPILPLRLFIPSNYPKSSPVLLDKLPDEQSMESDDLSLKARSRFVIYLRNLSQPMSLGEMVKTWDACAQRVITEYAQQTGGGTFSSIHGAWENCVGA